MSRILCWLLLAALPLLCEGRERRPWGERDLELYPNLELSYLYYPKLASSRGSKKVSSSNLFCTTSLYAAYTPWMVELELGCLKSDGESFNFDEVAATGRYILYDDIIGDPISLVAGLTLIRATSVAVRDYSAFHHGRYEMEGHLSYGKELSCGPVWLWRFWGVTALGIADTGLPWIRQELCCARRWGAYREVGASLISLWGLGSEALPTESHVFRGYGSVAHRSVDLALYFQQKSDFSGWISLELFYRLLARNFPQDAVQLSLRYTYPFGL